MKKIYRVYAEGPTNFGYEKYFIKVFDNKSQAKKYFDETVKVVKKEAKDTDDVLSVVMEDIEIDNAIKRKDFNN